MGALLHAPQDLRRTPGYVHPLRQSRSARYRSTNGWMRHRKPHRCAARSVLWCRLAISPTVLLAPCQMAKCCHWAAIACAGLIPRTCRTDGIAATCSNTRRLPCSVATFSPNRAPNTHRLSRTTSWNRAKPCGTRWITTPTQRTQVNSSPSSPPPSRPPWPACTVPHGAATAAISSAGISSCGFTSWSRQRRHWRHQRCQRRHVTRGILHLRLVEGIQHRQHHDAEQGSGGGQRRRGVRGVASPLPRSRRRPTPLPPLLARPQRDAGDDLRGVRPPRPARARPRPHAPQS